MKKLYILLVMVIMALAITACSSGENKVNDTVMKDNSVNENSNKDNSESIQSTEIPADKEQNSDSNETKEEDTSIIDNFSDLYESSSISIGDIKFNFPIAWDDLTPILDANNADYSDFTHDLSVSDNSMQKVIFDEERNGFNMVVKRIDDEIVITRIEINLADGLIVEETPVKFDGMLDENSDINDAIKLYGEPDEINEKNNNYTEYCWYTTENRKLNLRITTGLKQDPDKIFKIIVYNEDN